MASVRVPWCSDDGFGHGHGAACTCAGDVRRNKRRELTMTASAFIKKRRCGGTKAGQAVEKNDYNEQALDRDVKLARVCYCARGFGDGKKCNFWAAPTRWYQRGASVTWAWPARARKCQGGAMSFGPGVRWKLRKSSAASLATASTSAKLCTHWW